MGSSIRLSEETRATIENLVDRVAVRVGYKRDASEIVRAAALYAGDHFEEWGQRFRFFGKEISNGDYVSLKSHLEHPAAGLYGQVGIITSFTKGTTCELKFGDDQDEWAGVTISGIPLAWLDFDDRLERDLGDESDEAYVFRRVELDWWGLLEEREPDEAKRMIDIYPRLKADY